MVARKVAVLSPRTNDAVTIVDGVTLLCLHNWAGHVCWILWTHVADIDLGEIVKLSHVYFKLEFYMKKHH